jgi:glutaconate CoA-transferase, subunit A
MAAVIRSLDEALTPITDGCTLLVPRETAGVAMEATRALVRKGVKRLDLVTLPTSSLQADMLIGAGCVDAIETSAVSLAEFGGAPRFNAAVTSGAVRVKDTTCPAMHARLQATEKGVPFMPLRGIIGSDLLRVRPEWIVIDNPLAESGTRDPIVILPAIRPDVTLFHALKADSNGNVWVGVQRELITMSHASAMTLVTVESIEDGDFLRDPMLAPGTLPSLYVTAIAEVKNGAWPIGLDNAYAADAKALREYAAAAATAEGFARWCAAEPSAAVHA